jgi:hypothetical protein
MKNTKRLMIIVGILVAGIAARVSAQEIKPQVKTDVHISHLDKHKMKGDKLKSNKEKVKVHEHQEHKNKGQHKLKEKDKRKEKDVE